jgi:hypothetical protein
VRLGRPPEVPDEVAAQIRQLCWRRLTATAIARQLAADGVPAPRGASSWHVATVAQVIAGKGGQPKRGRPAKTRRQRQRRWRENGSATGNIAPVIPCREAGM